MTRAIKIRQGTQEDVAALLAIAGNLPSWFTEGGLRKMAADLAKWPTLVAEIGDELIGFLCFSLRSQVAYIEWMAVRRDCHRSGIGRQLVEALAEHLRTSEVTAMRVETLGDSVVYEPYAQTRAFYRGLGFREFARKLQADPEWPDRLTLDRPVAQLN